MTMPTPNDEERAKIAAADLVEWRESGMQMIIELQMICAEFGVLGGERRTSGIHRVLTDQAATISRLTAELARVREAALAMLACDPKVDVREPGAFAYFGACDQLRSALANTDEEGGS